MAGGKKDLKLTWETPIVIARYPALITPKVFKDPETGQEGKPRYECNGVFDEEHVEPAKEFMKRVAEKFFPGQEFVKKPFGTDKKDPNVFFIKAHSGADYRVPLFDAKNNKLPEGSDIGSGSRVRLALSLKGYVQGGIPGITAYLNQIQVIELVAPIDGKSRFEATDGFTFSEDAEEETTEEVKGGFSDLNAKDMFAF